MNHRSWYDDKRFIVIDKNFEMMEKDLLRQLKNNLDSKFNWSNAKNTTDNNRQIKHVSEIDQSNINVNMDFGSMHKIHPETVKFNDKYVDNYSENNKPTITASDPYNEIHGRGNNFN